MRRSLTTVLPTLAAIGVTLAFDRAFGSAPLAIVVPFCATSVAAAWLGGPTAGLLSAVVGTVGLVVLLAVPGPLPIVGSPDVAAALLAFIVVSVVCSWLVSLTRGDQRPVPRRLTPSAGWLVAFSLANVAAAGIGQGLKLVPGVAITFWPPSGIFVAALLLNHRRTWPWWVCVALLSELLGNALWFHNPPHLALLYFAANAAEALAAAVLVQKAIAGRSPALRPRQLELPRNALLFALLAGLIAPMVGASIIATTDAIIGKHPFWSAWLFVWLGDGTGLMLAAPLAVASVQLWRQRATIAMHSAAEFTATAAIATLVTWLALRAELPSVYVVLPAVVWSAVRFQLWGAWVVLSLVILTVAAFTRAGMGEFAGPPEAMQARLIALQVFLGVCTSSALVVAGLSARLNRAQEGLRLANASLARRIGERTRALQESEDRFRLALHGSNVILAQCDPELRYVWIHGAHRDFATDEVVGRRDTEIADNSGTRELEALKRDVRDRRVQLTRPITFPAIVGQPTYSVRAEPRFDASGALEAIVTVGVDITQHKRFEEQLRGSEEQLRRAMDAANAGSWQVDLDTGAFDASDRARAIHDVESDTPLTHERAIACVHPDDRVRVETSLNHSVTTGERFHTEHRVLRRDGTITWVATHAEVERSGGRARLMGLVQDVTDRKREEAKLREAESLFRTMADAAPVLIWQTDASGVSFVNQHYIDFFGLEGHTIGGMSWSEFVHPDERDAYLEVYRSAFARQVPFEFIARFRHRDGAFRWLQNSGRPHLTPDGTFTGFIGCSFDVSAVKRAEEALREGDRKKDEFLATLAHELRNPLAPIRAGLHILQLAPGDAALVSSTREMLDRQVRQMVRLIDDLMDVSRISQGKIILQKERIVVGDAIASAVEACRPLMDAKGHELEVQLPAEPLSMHGDLTRLSQVFVNLLNNAAKYTDRGGRVRLVAERQGDEAVVTVIDNGVGIPAAMLDSVFEMFTQVDRSLEKSQGGLGIGLNITKRLVEKHGGRLAVASEGPGTGSAFTVRLPLA